MWCAANSFFTASFKSPTRILSDGNHVFIRVRSCPLRTVKHRDSPRSNERLQAKFVAFTVKSVSPAHCKFTKLYEGDLQRSFRTENDTTVDVIRERVFPKG